MKGFAQLSLAAMVATASATAINVNKRDSPLSVVLTASGNSEVKVAVTNNGEAALNLLSTGTFLDEVNPVEKVSMFSGEKKVTFEGLKIRLLTSGLGADDFVALGAGETKEVTVETAALHAVNEGGDFDVFAEGLVPVADADYKLVDNIPYSSNKLSMTIDGAIASTVKKALTKRSAVGSSCTGTKLSAVNTALSNCNKLATAAAAAATSSTRYTTYFKTASATTVKARLTAVASDCGSTSGTKTTSNCDDQYSGCSSNVLAYTVPSTSPTYITYCSIFFTALPAISSTCHAQDQATTVLHEETHASTVYSPGTQDNGYGYTAAIALSASQALNNADSYALFANAVYVGC